MIDYDSLRKDMKEESLGAAFVGHFGGAYLEAEDTRRASDEELLKIAKRNGINIERYRK